MKNIVRSLIGDGGLTRLMKNAGGSTVAAGKMLVNGDCHGIVASDIAAGDTGPCKCFGYDVRYDKVSAQAWAVGDKIYYDPGVDKVTNVAGALKQCGIATEAAANPSSTGIFTIGFKG